MVTVGDVAEEEEEEDLGALDRLRLQLRVDEDVDMLRYPSAASMEASPTVNSSGCFCGGSGGWEKTGRQEGEKRVAAEKREEG